MNLRNEIERRENMEEDISKIIGTEIKNRRLSMSMTLAALAEDTCSTSYLCKIEKSQIVANDRRLEEICRRVGMSQDQYKDLLNLKVALNYICDYYFNDDKVAITNLKNTVKEFSNYRSNIINYVISIYEKETRTSYKLCKSILSIIKEISDLDLLVFITFYAIDLMAQGNYIEAADNIKAVIGKKSGIKNLYILQLETLFECAFQTNAMSIYDYSNTLAIEYYEKNFYERSQKLYAKMSAFELLNERVEHHLKFFAKVKDNQLRYNLSFMKSFLAGEYSKVKKYNLKKLKPILQFIYWFYFELDTFQVEYKKRTQYSFTEREKLFLDYLHAKNDNRRTNFILNVGIPKAIERYDGLMMQFYLDELSSLLLNQGSYLCFYESYRNVFACKKMIKQI